jgi:hypothetical protein
MLCPAAQENRPAGAPLKIAARNQDLCPASFSSSVKSVFSPEIVDNYFSSSRLTFTLD